MRALSPLFASPLFAASVAAAILSMAPANAEQKGTRCTDTNWQPVTASTPCPTVKQPAKYEDCIQMYRNLGWKGSEREWCAYEPTAGTPKAGRRS